MMVFMGKTKTSHVELAQSSIYEQSFKYLK